MKREIFPSLAYFVAGDPISGFDSAACVVMITLHLHIPFQGEKSRKCAGNYTELQYFSAEKYAGVRQAYTLQHLRNRVSELKKPGDGKISHGVPPGTPLPRSLNVRYK